MNKLIGGGLILAMLSGNIVNTSIGQKGDYEIPSIINTEYLEDISNRKEFIISPPNIEEMMKIDNEVTDEDMENWESWSNWKTMKIKQEEERKAKEELERLEEEKMKKQSIKEETTIQNNNSNSSNSVVINQPSNESGYDLGNFNVSFYTAYCAGCSGITATGIDVRNTNYYNGMQVIATDPNVIPLYSIVELRFSNGNTVKAIAMDTGGAIKGNRIDYLVSSTNEAISNGRQTASVKIIRKGGD